MALLEAAISSSLSHPNIVQTLTYRRGSITPSTACNAACTPTLCLRVVDAYPAPLMRVVMLLASHHYAMPMCEQYGAHDF